MKTFKQFLNEIIKEPLRDAHGQQIRPKNFSIEHKGKTYHSTGKVGNHIATGEASHEYEADDSSRIWVRHKSGKIDND